MIRQFIVYVTLFVSNSIIAQQTINAKIVCSNKDLPIKDAIIKNNNYTTTSNKDGEFEIKYQSKKDSITISHYDFYERNLSIEEVINNNTIKLTATNNISLGEITITAHGNNKLQRESTSAISVIPSKELKQENSILLDQIIEKVPGAQINSIGNYNTRISIRGSGNRATTGSRNIKVYLNDIPLTQSTGMTWLGSLNSKLFDRVEVLKGPASGVYGLGTGGVIRFKTLAEENNTQYIQSSINIGTFGTLTNTNEFYTANDNFKSKIIYQNASSNGYRDFSSNNSELWFVNSAYDINSKESIDFQFIRTNQNSKNPGPISESQIQENRSQANEKFVNTNSGRDQIFNRYGLTYRNKFDSNFKGTFSLFGSNYDYYFRKPSFILPGTFQEVGYRFTLKYNPNFNNLNTIFWVGNEYQKGNFRHVRFKNENGTEGVNTINTNEKSTLQNYFVKAETKLSETLKTSIDLGVNNVKYEQRNYLNSDLSNQRNFKTQFTPRIALSYIPNTKNAFHLSLSKGFSPPSFQETRTIEGILNTELEPETGLNYEFRTVNKFFNGKLKHQTSLFFYQGNNELVKQSLDNGDKYFLNAGKTERLGLESSLKYSTLTNSTIITKLSADANFHWFDFNYLDYNKTINGIKHNFNGNDIVGISPFHLNTSLNLDIANDFFLKNVLTYNAKTPLNDEGSIYNGAYYRYDIIVGYNKEDFILNNLSLSAILSIKNISKQKYNEYFELNLKPNSTQYYYPAPFQTLNLGLTLKYLIN